jgi:hypothetical protein
MNQLEKLNRLKRTIDLISIVRNDYQLTEGHEDYLGFINMSVDGLIVSEMMDLEAFVSLYFENPTLVNMLLQHVGLYANCVSLDETIICDSKDTHME